MDLQIHAKTFHQESLGMILIFYNTRENRWFSFFTLQERIAQKGIPFVSELEIPIHLHNPHQTFSMNVIRSRITIETFVRRIQKHERLLENLEPY